MTQEIRTRDSFDIGTPSERSQAIVSQEDIIGKLLANPQGLVGALGLNEKQALNISSIITGGVAGAGRKWLTEYIGAELAGAVGGFVGAYVSKKITGR